LQSVDCVLAIHDVESGVHNKQVFDNVAAEVPEYVALPQFVHGAGPDAILYWPARQAVQASPFRPVYPALHVHAVITVLPAGDEAKDFVRQSVHVKAVEAPDDPENVPGRQSVHVAGPVSVLYLPAAHWRHVPPLGPDDPVLHVQLVEAALPAGDDASEDVVQAVHVDSANAPLAVEYLPAPQFVQVAGPVSVLYLPASHWTHVPPFGPENPTLQVQPAKAEAPAGEFEFAGQAALVSVVAPVLARYLFIGLSVHEADPVVVLNFPAAHCRQFVAPPVPVYPRLQMQSVCAVLVVVGVVLPARHAVQPPDPDVIL
jgi:hypothetical protein